MQFRSAIIASITFFGATQVMGAAIQDAHAARAIQIATDSHSACGLPNNGDHKQGDSCEYYTTPSSDGPTFKGTCQYDAGTTTLNCV